MNHSIQSVEQRVEAARKSYNSKSQMSKSQVEWIIRQCGDRLDGSLLVFGLGYDSLMWSTICETVFLEDDYRWYRRIFADPLRQGLRAYPVNYQTRVDSWEKDLLNHTLNTLPPEISGRRFDVIIIDGPRGSSKNSPGRVSAMLHARRLVRDGGMVFVDDMTRSLEKQVSHCVFGEPAASHRDRSTIACWQV